MNTEYIPFSGKKMSVTYLGMELLGYRVCVCLDIVHCQTCPKWLTTYSPTSRILFSLCSMSSSRLVCGLFQFSYSSKWVLYLIVLSFILLQLIKLVTLSLHFLLFSSPLNLPHYLLPHLCPHFHCLSCGHLHIFFGKEFFSSLMPIFFLFSFLNDLYFFK